MADTNVSTFVGGGSEDRSDAGAATFSLFQDSEFEQACKELEEPQTEGWEFFVESHGVTIYRLYNEVRYQSRVPAMYRGVLK